jgi:hypothetical protein
VIARLVPEPPAASREVAGIEAPRQVGADAITEPVEEVERVHIAEVHEGSRIVQRGGRVPPPAKPPSRANVAAVLTTVVSLVGAVQARASSSEPARSPALAIHCEPPVADQG